MQQLLHNRLNAIIMTCRFVQQNATLIDLSAIITEDDDQLVKGGRDRGPESAGHYEDV